jgi:hypothetical protein
VPPWLIDADDADDVGQRAACAEANATSSRRCAQPAWTAAPTPHFLEPVTIQGSIRGKEPPGPGS